MIATASPDQSPDAARLETIEGRWTLQILLCLNGGDFLPCPLASA